MTLLIAADVKLIETDVNDLAVNSGLSKVACYELQRSIQDANYVKMYPVDSEIGHDSGDVQVMYSPSELKGFENMLP